MSCMQGPFPSALKLAPNLVALHMSQNKLSGFLPNQLGMFPSLASFNVSNNMLQGEIPESLGGIAFFNHQVCTIW